MPDRHAVTAADAPSPVGPYSHAVRSGDLLFCSGMVALDPASNELLHAADVGAQTRQALDNLEAICAAAGARLRDAVRVTVFAVDLPGDWGAINAAYAEWFADLDAPPARAAVGVAALPLGARVEIDAVVAVG